ncbi:MAG: PleD family two-component system response regulator, partial [Promethearchaeota archaeon]
DLLNSLKEILTSIKGYSHLFLEKSRSELSDEMLSLSKNIFKHSLLIKNKIDRFSEDLQILTPNYDILIMHHDISILRVVKKYYEEKGYSCKAVPSCAIGLEDLKKTVPKVILLGIVMPALSGYDVCKTIKSDKRYENVLLFYMSAMPPSEIEKNLRETKADGYVSLPFDYSDLDNVIEILKTKESNN